MNSTASEILSSVAAHPSLLRWLHSHDPDRDLSVDLLDASATYSTAVSSAELAASPIPPTSSLFVPMYRRSHYILGQLYGPMSPNAMALNILAQAGYGSPPHPISRRFVVDLSFDASLQFIEYEWFSDGKLCVSMHKVTNTGHYDGQSILLGDPSGRHTNITKDDLLPGNNRPASPTKVLMRMYLSEGAGCNACQLPREECTCEVKQIANHPFQQPTSWETWLGSFGMSRLPVAHMSMKFVMRTPFGDIEHQSKVTLSQSCEVGVRADSPKGNKLLLMFMQSAGMLLSAPNVDQEFVSAQEKKELQELANDLDDENYFPPPEEISLSVTASIPANIVTDASASAHTSAALLQEDSLVDACLSPLNSTLHNPLAQHQAAYASGVRYDAMPRTGARQAQTAIVNQTRAADRAIQREPRTRRRSRNKDRIFVCECGKVFTHKGHYNEHRLCVHEKVRHHQCLFENCNSRFFKRSDRDRHMRAKHDATNLACTSCGIKVPSRTALDEHTCRQSNDND